MKVAMGRLMALVEQSKKVTKAVEKGRDLLLRELEGRTTGEVLVPDGNEVWEVKNLLHKAISLSFCVDQFFQTLKADFIKVEADTEDLVKFMMSKYRDEWRNELKSEMEKGGLLIDPDDVLTHSCKVCDGGITKNEDRDHNGLCDRCLNDKAKDLDPHNDLTHLCEGCKVEISKEMWEVNLNHCCDGCARKIREMASCEEVGPKLAPYICVGCEVRITVRELNVNAGFCNRCSNTPRCALCKGVLLSGERVRGVCGSCIKPASHVLSAVCPKCSGETTEKEIEEHFGVCHSCKMEEDESIIPEDSCICTHCGKGTNKDEFLRNDEFCDECAHSKTS